MNRELIVLGTASQVPTRQRNQNGYLLRWDDQGILFDPGEGAQRQLMRAGATASDITSICITHFHGDHCLGLPGIVQRLSLDQVPHAVTAHYPASGAEFFARLRHASVFLDLAYVVEAPIVADGELRAGLSARRLNHPVESFGYRLAEPDGRRMLPERLAALGISGPAIGQLQRAGSLEVGGRVVGLDEVSEHKRGQVFAFVMDTGWCDAAIELAADADMLVIESTFLQSEAVLAAEAGHLTAAQAAQIAHRAGARKLVLTHFSQRYTEPAAFADEAAQHFSGEIVVAEDLMRIPLR
ncbi:MAG TPA: ribonuclease Z [Micromonosporaceae bacterium]|nr:ribonuclease Z [Micromonosporaceae bacterium]